ncbi:MAG: hypothetical protein ABSB40_13075 [Nitrososphaeria archaeon]|jgi:hypothetical protein
MRETFEEKILRKELGYTLKEVKELRDLRYTPEEIQEYMKINKKECKQPKVYANKKAVVKPVPKKGFMGAVQYNDLTDEEKGSMIFDCTFFPFIIGVPLIMFLVFGKWGVICLAVLTCSALIGTLEAVPVILAMFIGILFLQRK